MRLVHVALAAALATASFASETAAQSLPDNASGPYGSDLIIADDRPVVLDSRAAIGEPVLSFGARYRRTGRLAEDATFSLFGLGKRTLPAGTPVYFRGDQTTISVAGVSVTLWCAPEVELKGRKQPACLLYRDMPFVRNQAELIDVSDANPWLIVSFRPGKVSSRGPEIHEEDVGFPTMISVTVSIDEWRDDKVRIATTKEAPCDGCALTKITTMRWEPVQPDGSVKILFGDAGALILRPAEGEADYDVLLEGRLAEKAVAAP